jgi:hypothetical protein
MLPLMRAFDSKNFHSKYATVTNQEAPGRVKKSLMGKHFWETLFKLHLMKAPFFSISN